ncbi:MAG: glycosyltransferase involved in cell wall [Gammaproteobacteria bacterium]|nr:MAG: glycosyltransferase involved in cell wall [Gammaproteobacteria bacterium]TND00633.1 MAG: glycosyltransferase involved in cell wall [Gammaproteobacteria bacterium]
MSSSKPRASVIIAIYKDVEALHCVLAGLMRQTEPNFEVIVTEDGDDAAVAAYIATRTPEELDLHHLTQDDIGFRKTRAVNRAIASARSDYLIFLDGDCIPHQRFVEKHLLHAEPGRICTGRRVYLGPQTSARVRQEPDRIIALENRLTFFLRMIPLHVDGIRNYELGFPSDLLHRLVKRRQLGIMGCNFSCYREDIERINGYNEDLPGIGGEDDDLEWRFNGLGMFTKNIKFQVTTYHLHHPSRRQDTEVNLAISKRNREKREYFCPNGIRKDITSPDPR